MGYLHIDNLYKNQTILMFKECYALEKIHGTSAHIAWNNIEKSIRYFSGGESHEKFVNLFNEQELIERFYETFPNSNAIIYGEAYGGKQQGMSGTYGKYLKFIAFDVKVNDLWLHVPNAEGVVCSIGLEFVDYKKVSTDLDCLDAERDKDSTQAIRNGVGEGKKREGVVLRPLVEFTMNNGKRIITKHKRDDFRETKTKRKVSQEDLKVLEDAKEIAEEWVTEMRLNHVLDKLPKGINVESTGMVIKAMIEDVFREADGEIVKNKKAKKYIGSRTAKLFKEKLQNDLRKV